LNVIFLLIFVRLGSFFVVEVEFDLIVFVAELFFAVKIKRLKLKLGLKETKNQK